MFIISIKLSKRVTHMFVCASVWESSAVLGCARLCWCACKQWAVQRRRVLLPGGKGVWKCDRSVDKERGSNSRSRNSTSSSGSNINRSNNNDDGDPVGNWSKAAAKLTATQAIFREKPGKHNNRGQIIFSSNGNSLALKRRLYQETRLVMALFVVSANLRQTHTHSHILRERERASKSEVDQDKSSESLYCCVEIVFNFRYLTNGDTSAVAARTPASSPGRLGQDFNNMCTPTHVCVSWGFVNNKFLCRKTRSCLWQSPIRCSILGLSRIIIIIIRIIVRISISRSGFVCTAEKR